MEQKFYDGQKLLSRNTFLNLCIGGRNIGKTFYYKKYCLNQFLNHGKQFIYLRRTQTELDTLDKESFFPETLLEQVFPDFKIIDNNVTKSGKRIKFETSRKGLKQSNVLDINSKRILLNGEIICYLKSLSTWVKLKGSEYDKVFTILFDEVFIDITSKNQKHYLNYEYSALTQLAISVFRRRQNCRLILLSNSTNYNNPYFNHFKFDGDNKKRFWKLTESINGNRINYGTIEFAPDKGINIDEMPDIYAMMSGTEIFESNISNEFQEKMYANIGKINGNKTRLFSVYCNGYCVTAYDSGGKIYIGKGYDKNLFLYTFKINDLEKGCIFADRSNPISKGIRRNFYNNNIFFENLEVKTNFLNSINPII